MKRIILVISALFLAINVSGQALSSLLIPADPRSLSMGGAYVPSYDAMLDAQAVFGIWAPSYAHNIVAGADGYLRLGDRIILTLGGKDFIDKPYDISGDQGAIKGSFKPYELILSIGGAYCINDAISAGIALKTITSVLGDNAKSSAFCGDLWGKYSGASYYAGLAIRNLGTPINYGNGAYNLPSLIAAHGGWTPVKGLNVAAEADFLFSGTFMAGAGAEYCYADIVTARAGFHYGDPSKALPTFASLGLGGKFFGVHLDAAYIFASPTIGNSFMISLGYAF